MASDCDPPLTVRRGSPGPAETADRRSPTPRPPGDRSTTSWSARRPGYAVAKNRQGWYSLPCVCYQHGPLYELEKVMGKGNNSQKNDKKSKKPKQGKSAAAKKK